MKDDKDIRDVIQDEKSRLPRARKSAKQKEAKWLKEADRLLKRGTEEEMLAAIRDAGMEPASPEGQNALRVWRENRY